jgi:transcriptional regulator with XRE-family HTH domain
VDNELGDFLRARRDLVSPRDVGLPDDGTRRVAGLRREEVALLAGVSTDYYIRLEQGRERRPSDQVLAAIAQALRLDDDAAEYLFRLGLPGRPAETATTEVGPELLRLMDHFLDVPAFVLGPALDVLAANALAEALYSGFARFDNLLRMVFLDPFAREFYADWDRAATVSVSNLRASAAPFPGDYRVAHTVGELSVRSPAFASLWARYEVHPRAGDDKLLRHPQVGDLYLHHEAFAVTSAPGQKLTVYTAEPGTPSADGLKLLSTLVNETKPVAR